MQLNANQFKYTLQANAGMAPSVTAIFPDTNILLHFPPLREVDWVSKSGNQPVELVICLTVIDELDAKKSDPRLSERAERAIKDIQRALRSGQPIREGVTIKIYAKDVSGHESSDDAIIEALKSYQDENGQIVAPIATNDYGMEIRAAAKGVATIHFDSSEKLPHPQDEQARKLREVTSELNELKYRIPKLELFATEISSEVETTEFGVLSPQMSEFHIDDEIKQIEDEYPYLGNSIGDKYFRGLSTIPQHEVERYNRDLSDFFEKYRAYFEGKNELAKLQTRSIYFSLWVRNAGTIPATDIDIHICFPETIQDLFRKGDKRTLFSFINKPSEPPNPPHPPEVFSSASRRFFEDEAAQAARLQKLFEMESVNVSLNNTQGLMRVHATTNRLKHGQSVHLGDFTAVFTKVSNFALDYAVTASELPKPISGKMVFKIRS